MVVQLKALVDNPSALPLTPEQAPGPQKDDAETSPLHVGVGEVAMVKLKVRENLKRIREVEQAKVRDINERVQRDGELVAIKKANLEQEKKDKAKAELDAINAKVAERMKSIQVTERAARDVGQEEAPPTSGEPST